MSLSSYFGFAAEKAFAKTIAGQLFKELPANLIEKRQKLMSVNKVTRMLERGYRQAAEYRREKRIGFIKRAVLANAYKWELKQHGYPDEFVDMATEGLVVAMSRPQAPTDTPAA